MTWHYDIAGDNSSMDIYDHTGTLVATLSNDGSGFGIPDDVLDVMVDEAQTARTNANIDRWRDIHIRLARRDIAPGAP